MKTLNLLAWQFASTSDFEKSIVYAEQAINLSGKLNYKKGKATSLNTIGTRDWYLGNYSGALTNYVAALEIQKEIGDKKGMAGSYNNIGMMYYYVGTLTRRLYENRRSFRCFGLCR